MNYDWSSLFQKMTNIDQYSRELILTIESSLQNNKLQPKIDKMTVILMVI